MKDRIGIDIIAVVSLLLSCGLVCVGCTPPITGAVLIEVDSGSALMQPTFCMYQGPYLGPYSQKRFDIKSITVWKVPPSPDQKKRWKFHLLWDDRQTVWHLEYKVSDNFIKRLLGGQPSTVSRLTYGKTPAGYQEVVKAGSLELEEFYGVEIREVEGQLSQPLYFIIRLDGSGTPERLEYHQRTYLFHLYDAIKPRDALKFY